MISLKKFNTRDLSNTGVEIPLKDLRTGKPTDAFIRVHGYDSEAFAEVKAARSRALLEKADENGNVKVTPQEMDDVAADMCARMTMGWRGLTDESDNELVYSPDAARQLYIDYPAIREQINQAIADRSNFLKA